jgi:hypothetical protein
MGAVMNLCDNVQLYILPSSSLDPLTGERASPNI